jgi:ubiquinone biosynthesis monooxygenase Coq7
MNDRTQMTLDRLIGQLDQALHTVFGPTPIPGRENPARQKTEVALSGAERDLAGRLMRINHVGEICAQALYQGQAVTARRPDVREKMQQASREENDHLAWTEERLRELGSHASYLNPLWYSVSYAFGALAGIIGDKWSLGFIAETEKQVVEHLTDHLHRIPAVDTKSRAILEQMRIDEGQHATVAIESGGAGMPEPVKQLMRGASKIMTRTAYWI